MKDVFFYFWGYLVEFRHKILALIVSWAGVLLAILAVEKWFGGRF